MLGGVLDGGVAAARLGGERAQIGLQRRHEGHPRLFLLLLGLSQEARPLGVRVLDYPLAEIGGRLDGSGGLVRF